MMVAMAIFIIICAHIFTLQENVNRLITILIR